MTNIEAIAFLAANGTSDFARSLVSQFNRKRSLSDKQWPWVHKIAAELANGGPARKELEVGDMSGAEQLFEKAKTHLKYPAVVLMTPSGTEVKLKQAGPRSKNPGSINVVDHHTGDWYGRVLNGKFQLSNKVAPPKDLWQLLVSFAQNPARTASEHGRMTGRCCFCNIALKDERSTAVGYGPICAKHWELPWGQEKFEFTPKSEAA